MVDATSTTLLTAVTGSRAEQREDQLAVEEPLEIRLDWFDGTQMQRQSIAITMRTPGHDQELACGFLLGEGLVRHATDIQSVEFSGSQAVRGQPTNVLRVVLERHCRVDLERLQRHFYTSSSCGVCGKASLEALEMVGARPLEGNTFQVSATALHQLAEQAANEQSLFHETGGLHAAGLFNAVGEILCLREDVGRHNALDKVIGHLLRADQLPAGHSGIFVSGRASFELMQKTVMAGIPLLAAVGAPSSLAVELAVEYNITLVGFMRDGRFNIYAGDHRVQVGDPGARP